MPKVQTAQNFLEIETIKNGVVILKNKGIRGIIFVSPTNFALKSEDEQKAIVYQFQQFLNSLDFPIQIIAQSRKLNLTAYFERLKELEQKQNNELLKIQIADYRKFIENIINRESIMTKNFFVVVPYSMGEMFGEISGTQLLETRGEKAWNDETFERAKAQLWQRINFIALGLRRCELNCAPLGTAELIELFWAHFHPQEAEVGYYPDIPPELII